MGALLRRKGYRVAPFKAQNMSNNAYVTLTGGEIGRAQAVQAEACGVVPTVEMNPILLKPSGELGSQLVVLGEAHSHVSGGDYYARIEKLWPVVTGALETLGQQYDVLVLEGAGSPVELNLMERDLVNLRPVRHLDGRWLLVADIERGGVFPQIIGTYQLMPRDDQSRGLGVVVNKFRGDLSLFAEAGDCLKRHIDLPYLGVLPYRGELQPETEDGVNPEQERGNGGESGSILAWIRFPHHANTSDAEPWSLDRGVTVRWVTRPEQLTGAGAIILPGSKNTLADLEWLRTSGFAEAILAAHRRGVLVVGICGGFQMLGESLSDADGVAGQAGETSGLSLLPLRTGYSNRKKVTQVDTFFAQEQWTAYEIHMGQSQVKGSVPALFRIRREGKAELSGEGCCRERTAQSGAVWGTYLHGLFESAAVRTALAQQAGITGHVPSAVPWREHLQGIYSGMADLIESRLNLEAVWKYLKI